MPNAIATPDGTPSFHIAGEYGYATLPNIAVLSDGTLIVAWTQYSDQIREVYAQRLNADGTPLDAPFMVNTTTAYDQRQPVITPLANGSFVVTWQSLAQDSYIENSEFNNPDIYAEQYGIYQRIFSADGTPLSGEELVNTSVDGKQLDHQVNVLPDGGYYTTWRSANYISDNDLGDFVFGQRFDANGDKIGGQVELPASFQVKPIALADGTIAFAWRGVGEEFDDIRITVMAPGGNSLHTFSVQSSQAAPNISYVEITALPDGNIFVASSYLEGSYDPRQIAGTVYSPSGSVIVATFQIHEKTGYDQSIYEVITLQNGNVLITFNDSSSVSLTGIVVSPDGTVLTDPIQLSASGPVIDRGYVTALDDGGFAVVYPANDGTIVTRIFDVDYTPTTTKLTTASDTYVETDNTGALIFALEGNDKVTGGDGNDRIYGADGNDSLDGGAGRDVLYGGIANDVLNGGDGDDTLEGNDNKDILNGDAGSDHLDGGKGDDFLYGGAGNDLLTGELGRDTLYGGDGDDRLHLGIENTSSTSAHFLAYGGDGDDRFNIYGADHTAYGDVGADQFNISATGDYYGGAGDDYFVATAGNIFGGSEYDSLVVRGDISVDMSAGLWSIGASSNKKTYGISDVEIFHFGSGFNGVYSENTWKFIGSSTSETVTYTWGRFTGTGGGGDDIFIAQNTATIDIFSVILSSSTINGGAGNDTIIGGTSLDTLTGASGNDLIDGGNFADVIYGGRGNDDLYGGRDKDTITGGAGNDIIDGGLGKDVVVLNGSMDDYTITAYGEGHILEGPDGTDYMVGIEYAIFGDGTKASFSNGTFTLIDQFPFNDNPTQERPLDDHISAQGGEFRFSIPEGTFVDPDTTLRYFAREEDAIGLPNWLKFDTTTQTFSGTPPAGFSGTITIRVYAHDDAFLGQSASDRFTLTIAPTGEAIVTGSNNAGGILTGGTTHDRLSGGTGDDVIHGGNGNDKITDAGGNNTLFGGSGHDQIAGGKNGDKINGGLGADIAIGGNGYDTINGAAGNDSLYGGNGRDKLNGASGADSLFGGANDDTLSGGFGSDRLTGGLGADTFIFANTTQSGIGSAADIITDFSANQGDIINLRAIDAKSGTGNQAFTFIGFDSFSSEKGELRIVDRGDDIRVLGDRNGDGVADFSIIVRDVDSLNTDDFIL